MRLEIVEWLDAWTEDTETDLSKIECKPTPVKTVGWVVAENQHGVLLACELYDDHPGTTRYPTFIPRGMITNRITLSPESPSA